MRGFRLSVEAQRDLLGIGKYTEEQWGKKQRNGYLKQLDAAFRLLGSKPEIGHAVDHIRKGCRQHPQGSHVIYYRAGSATKVEIIRVLHKSVDVELHL